MTDDLELDYDDLEAKLSDRTRVVAFPVAANSVGTAPDVRRVVELAHAVGALAWADAVHYAPHGPIDVSAWDVDVLICSPYKFFGPHMGLAFGKRELLESWRAVQGSAGRERAGRTPVRARHEPARAARGLRRGRRLLDLARLGRDALARAALGERFLAGLPESVELYGIRGMDGRVPTFCFNVPGHSAEQVAIFLAEREIAVWHGDYYAVETMKHLGLADGAVRAGIVHYNTEDEVDRLLDGLAALA